MQINWTSEARAMKITPNYVPYTTISPLLGLFSRIVRPTDDCRRRYGRLCITSDRLRSREISSILLYNIQGILGKHCGRLHSARNERLKVDRNWWRSEVYIIVGTWIKGVWKFRYGLCKFLIEIRPKFLFCLIFV